MAYQQLPMDQVPVKDLALDLDNYRVPIRPEDEAAALNYLFAEEDVLEAATLILREGYFDNEVPIVVQENGTHVVLEGNRRVSALKALHEPGLVPSHRAEIERLLKRYAIEANDLPDTIRVLVAPSREIARPHIARLHTGLPKKRWSRDQQANYYYSLLADGTTVDDLKRAYPDVEIVRFLKMVPMRKFLTGVKYSDASLLEYVKSKLTMSAFEYAYNKPDIAGAIGVAFDRDGRLLPTSSTPEAIGAGLNSTQRAGVELLMSRFRANALNTRSVEFKRDNPQRNFLVAELNGTHATVAHRPVGASTSTTTSETAGESTERDPGSGDPSRGSGTATTPGGGAASTTTTPGSRGSNHPDTKKTLSLSGLDFATHASRNLQLRYHELRKLDLTQVPAAAAMLLRSVLETTIKFHFESTSTPAEGQLQVVFKRVAETYGKHKPLQHSIARIQSAGSNVPGSVTWFNIASHSAELVVDAQQVRDAYSLIEPVLRRLLQPPAHSAE
ncbi:hypothetical protein [Cellulomonas sp. ES6]|uniref:hypothetical protein n=1 Tax=Cellulomonas sp. ES6 TaxID=3039384 RepID=UPI0024B6DBE0|nr:hypothetical protein [Cellulomonas sp. ES6]WHP16618.1 hypothetical protein P9841_13470 [Cellulomonas sp. ES6]